MSSNSNQAKKAGQASSNNNGNSWNNWSDSNNWNNWNNNWNNGNWADWGKTASAWLDYNGVRRSASRNLEALTAANQVCLESWQAISRRAAEALQYNAQQAYNCAREACNSTTPQEAQNKHAHCLTSMVQNLCDNAKEATQIASKASMEVVELMNRRAEESTHEWANCCASSKK